LIFFPEDREILDKIETLLSDYSLEELLDDNDLTLAEAILLLYLAGHIRFPDWSNVT
jgi:hypothetical protein